MSFRDFLSKLSGTIQSDSSDDSSLFSVDCPDCGEPMIKGLFGWECPNGCGEALSSSDAADIWRSSGKDEDYMFGYSEDELENGD